MAQQRTRRTVCPSELTSDCVCHVAAAAAAAAWTVGLAGAFSNFALHHGAHARIRTTMRISINPTRAPALCSSAL
jgi:hypothetical protein